MLLRTEGKRIMVSHAKFLETYKLNVKGYIMVALRINKLANELIFISASNNVRNWLHLELISLQMN